MKESFGFALAFVQYEYTLGSVHTELLAIAIALVLVVIAKNGYSRFFAPLLLRAQCERTLKHFQSNSVLARSQW